MLRLRPDLVVAFPGGRGTADMVAAATDAGIPVRIVPDTLLAPEDQQG
jgi:ABC-type Fe3+-hydroxamate transport system substrate-binding protein